MHTADIQAALKKKGLSQRQVATDLGGEPDHGVEHCAQGSGFGQDHALYR